MKNWTDIIEAEYEQRVSKLISDFYVRSEYDWTGAQRILQRLLISAKKTREHLLALDWDVVILFRENSMAAKFKIGIKETKRGQRGAVQPEITWSTLQAGAELQLQYADGTPVPGVDPTAVTAAMTFDDPTKATATQDTDVLHWKLSKQGGVTGSVTLTGDFAFISGTPGPFQAILPIKLDTPGPSDVVIVVTGN